jgi:putative FmdB family regulatory protein
MTEEARVPIYVYRCQQCGEVLERRQRFQDPPLTTCEACSGELRKVLQPVGVIFRGSGFYSTDNRHDPDATSTDGKDTPSKREDHDAHQPAASADTSSSSEGKAAASTPAPATSSATSD